MEVAKQYGAKKSILIESIENFDEKIMKNVKNLGLTASASAPEVLVQNFIKLLKKKFTVIVNEPPYITENVIFKIPQQIKSII